MDLNKLKSYLIKENKIQMREPSKLTEMEKKALQKAERDIENGDVLTEEEANRDLEDWL